MSAKNSNTGLPATALQMSAYLTVESFSTWLRTYALHMKRELPDYWDHTMPLPPLTTQLTMTFGAVNHPLLTAWIDTPDLMLGGTVTLVTNGDQVGRVMRFTDARCVDAWQELVVVPTAPQAIMQQTVVLSLTMKSFAVPPAFAHWPPVSSN